MIFDPLSRILTRFNEVKVEIDIFQFNIPYPSCWVRVQGSGERGQGNKERLRWMTRRQGFVTEVIFAWSSKTGSGSRNQFFRLQIPGDLGTSVFDDETYERGQIRKHHKNGELFPARSVY